jgi:hypothetical protein
LLLFAIRDVSLHAVAWALLGVYPPARAHAILMRVGAHLRPIETADEALRVSRAIGRFGTCLSRSLAVAARLPVAEVVIGVAPRQNAPLFAHALVEIDGTPLDPAEVAGSVIVRLRNPRSRPKGAAAPQ